jgi:hypothetical protein
VSPEELTVNLQRLEANQCAYELVLSLLLLESKSGTRAAVRHLARETLNGKVPLDLNAKQRDQVGTTLLQLLQTGLRPDNGCPGEDQALDRRGAFDKN